MRSPGRNGSPSPDKSTPPARARVWSYIVTVPCAQLFDAGKCGCLDYDLEEGDDYQVILNLLGLLQEELGKPGALPGFDPEIQRKVAKSICTRPLSEGDHLQVNHSIRIRSQISNSLLLMKTC